MGLLLLRHCSQSCVARSRFHPIRPSFMCSYCQKEMGVLLALNPYQIVYATTHNYLGRCMKHISMQLLKKAISSVIKVIGFSIPNICERAQTWLSEPLAFYDRCALFPEQMN